ncbi:MAG: DUF2273 domain-containing protein [Clostridiales bacterium]|nr:DUF2273 domain-containing protein [Clostridiales bacterium]
MDNNKRFEVGTPACGLLCAALGIVLALCLIFLGFWKTLLIFVLGGVGYFCGACKNKSELFRATIDRIIPKKGE